MKFKESGKKMTLRKIKKIEEAINHILPDQYVRFLLKSNGGIPEKTVFTFEAFGEEEDSIVRIFYSVENEDKLNDLVTVYQVMTEEEQIDERFLPIAEDEFGNVICIGLDKEIFGQIFFWDHEEDDVTDSMHFVASDLNDFLLSLMEE